MLIDVEQGSKEWLAMRVGACTASRLGDVIAKLSRKSKSGEVGAPKASRAAYMRELVCERLTGLSADHYVTPYMQAGTENEPLARAAYEIAMDVETEDGGYAMHPRIQWFGASPDFLVGEDGCGEIKCLKAENHLAIIQNQTIPEEYLPQMIGELACTGRQWNDFVAYNKDFPKHLRLFVYRLKRTDCSATIQGIEADVEAFLAEVDHYMSSLPKGE